MKYLFFFLAVFLMMGAWSSRAGAQSQTDVETPLNIIVQDPDSATGTSTINSLNPHRPPNIGPTIIVSDSQFFSSVSAPFGLLGRSETAIASSSNGKIIVVGFNDANGFLTPLASQGLSDFSFSSDGGNTFTDGGGSLPLGTSGGRPVVTRGDPWLDVGGNGNSVIYYANLAARPAPSLASVGVIVHRGTVANNMLTWSAPAIITPPDSLDGLDKESLGADKTDSNFVYVSVTNFLSTGGSRIELYRSTDAGVTWGGPTIVKDPDPAGQQGSQVSVGTNGEVYVVWERGRFTAAPQILFRASTDHGMTFGPIQTVATITGTTLFPPVGYNRTRSNDFPRMAVNFTTGNHGRIYVTYQDAGTNPKIHTDGVFFNTTTMVSTPTGGVADGDIYLKFSDDMGATWSAATLVSSPAPGDGLDQFWPVVSVSPGGIVNIIYYQDTEIQSNPVNPLATNISVGAPLRRRSSYRSFVDVFWAQSQDGGATFRTPVRVNASTSNWSIAATNVIPNFGDYISGASGGNVTFATWAQSNLYDIDPTAAVNNRFVPSAAFAQISGIGQAFFKSGPLAGGTEAKSFTLEQNYPNPFNPTTTVRFTLPEESHVSLRIYNTVGEEVATVIDGVRPPGQQAAVFDARNLPSGMYFYKLVAGQRTGWGKMILSK